MAMSPTKSMALGTLAKRLEGSLSARKSRGVKWRFFRSGKLWIEISNSGRFSNFLRIVGSGSLVKGMQR